MYVVEQTSEFSSWLKSIKDIPSKVRLLRRLDKAIIGNLGDIKPVGQGVYEMREHFGPGWRMYYLQKGDVILLMLGGGNKSTQAKDINQAIALSRQFSVKDVPLEGNEHE